MANSKKSFFQIKYLIPFCSSCSINSIIESNSEIRTSQSWPKINRLDSGKRFGPSNHQITISPKKLETIFFFIKQAAILVFSVSYLANPMEKKFESN